MPSLNYRKTYLDLLGLRKKASKAELREAYRKKALRCHRAKESPARLQTFVELTVAFEFLKSYSKLSKSAFKSYEDQWEKAELPIAENKARKLASLKNKAFVRSNFYRELLEDSDDVAVFVAALGIVIALGLPIGLHMWKGTVGAIIGGVMTFMIVASVLPYARGWKKFRLSRFIGHMDLLFNEPIVLSVIAIVVNALAIPFVLFRFAIPFYIIPVTYLAAMVLFWIVSRTILKDRTSLYAKQFVLLGAPTFVSLFFLLNIIPVGQVTEESFTFKPRMEMMTYGLDSTSMIYLENNAYDAEMGIRIFRDRKGLGNDTITYRMSKSVGGLKYVRSWEFH